MLGLATGKFPMPEGHVFLEGVHLGVQVRLDRGAPGGQGVHTGEQFSERSFQGGACLLHRLLDLGLEVVTDEARWLRSHGSQLAPEDPLTWHESTGLFACATQAGEFGFQGEQLPLSLQAHLEHLHAFALGAQDECISIF
jgi:hypothetical protein